MWSSGVRNPSDRKGGRRVQCRRSADNRVPRSASTAQNIRNESFNTPPFLKQLRALRAGQTSRTVKSCCKVDGTSLRCLGQLPPELADLGLDQHRQLRPQEVRAGEPLFRLGKDEMVLEEQRAGRFGQRGDLQIRRGAGIRLERAELPLYLTIGGLWLSNGPESLFGKP